MNPGKSGRKVTYVLDIVLKGCVERVHVWTRARNHATFQNYMRDISYSKNFPTFFLFREKLCLASQELRGQNTPTVANIDTFGPGLLFLVLVYLYSLVKTEFKLIVRLRLALRITGYSGVAFYRVGHKVL